MDLVRAKRITVREAILLAHVDRWVNPFPGKRRRDD